MYLRSGPLREHIAFELTQELVQFLSDRFGDPDSRIGPLTGDWYRFGAFEVRRETDAIPPWMKVPLVQTVNLDTRLEDQSLQSDLDAIFRKSRSEPEPREIDIKARLDIYTRFEHLLGTFFDKVGYCMSECLTQEYSKYPGAYGAPGSLGCCVDDQAHKQSKADLILAQNRVEPVGFNDLDVCPYHTDDGCGIPQLRPVVCTSYVCSNQVRNIERLGIAYVWEHVESTLKAVVDGRLESPGISRVEARLDEYVSIVEGAQR